MIVIKKKKKISSMEGFTQDPVGFFGMYDMGVGGYNIVASRL